MASPDNVVEAAIVNKLNIPAITALLASPPSGMAASIYNTRAPQAASYPCVVFQFAGGGDENLTKVRMRNVVFLVKAISTASLYTAGLIDAQLDAALHMQTLTITGWTNFWTAREGDFQLVESPDTGGRTFFHQGGRYRIRYD